MGLPRLPLPQKVDVEDWRACIPQPKFVRRERPAFLLRFSFENIFSVLTNEGWRPGYPLR